MNESKFISSLCRLSESETDYPQIDQGPQIPCLLQLADRDLYIEANALISAAFGWHKRFRDGVYNKQYGIEDGDTLLKDPLFNPLGFLGRLRRYLSYNVGDRTQYIVGKVPAELHFFSAADFMGYLKRSSSWEDFLAKEAESRKTSVEALQKDRKLLTELELFYDVFCALNPGILCLELILSEEVQRPTQDRTIRMVTEKQLLSFESGVVPVEWPDSDSELIIASGKFGSNRLARFSETSARPELAIVSLKLPPDVSLHEIWFKESSSRRERLSDFREMLHDFDAAVALSGGTSFPSIEFKQGENIGRAEITRPLTP